MFDFIQLLENSPAWIIVTVGIVLIIIDVLVTSDSYLAWIGFAVIGVAGLNALDAPGSVQLGAFPVLTVISLAVVRRFFIKTSIFLDPLIFIDTKAKAGSPSTCGRVVYLSTAL